MTTTFEVIVTDASPLITLAKAKALDLLLRPRWPLLIPDAVFREATDPRFADATTIVEWTVRNPDAVTVVPTVVGLEQVALWGVGLAARDFGEQAALEVLRNYLDRRPTAFGILLYEDSDLHNLRAAIHPRLRLLTTGGFLEALQANGIIQSAGQILDDAEAAGRKIARQHGLPVSPDLIAAFRRDENER